MNNPERIYIMTTRGLEQINDKKITLEQTEQNILANASITQVCSPNSWMSSSPPISLLPRQATPWLPVP